MSTPSVTVSAPAPAPAPTTTPHEASTKLFVNRTLNMRKIKFIGLDMDHTLVRYHSHAFEELSHQTMCKKLVEQKHYPQSVLTLKFDMNLAVRGLVIDKKKGNLLKVSRHGAIRASYHGTKPIEFPQQQKLYKSTYIDLSDAHAYTAIDTAFSLSVATLFAQLVEIKDGTDGTSMPDYETMSLDVIEMLDLSHRDGSLKNEVARNLEKYIIKDESVVRGLERYKKHDKKFFIVTNSDFAYSKLLLDYAINPFLKDHKDWTEVFEYVVTLAQKPRFFWDNLRFLQVDPKTGVMTNYDEALKPGIYQGGGAAKFAKDLGVEGDDILYIGDHIYGDILRLKKDCNWRTALVVEELDSEIENYKKAQPYSNEIRALMERKEPLERTVVNLITARIEGSGDADEAKVQELQGQISEIDKTISSLIKKQQSVFNPHWGEVMRSGNEESYFANQVDRYACVYMPKLSDLLEYSPRTYFRS
ncbi:MAG: HAD-IG family 5'-nucleotidase, partial [Bdellovibrionales bacterium]|nr:HAD-IG family 5'-nucleotidase [Bdellovibrionales bacterium]